MKERPILFKGEMVKDSSEGNEVGLSQAGEGVIPAWIPCPDCEDYWCTIHNCHAFECECPPIDEWDYDPYSERREENGTRNTDSLYPVTRGG